MQPDFSTTTDDIKYVGNLSIMCAFKKYFDYTMMVFGCGIPSVTLKGTVQDWERILEKLQLLRKYEFDHWINENEPIIKKLIETRKGNIDIDFWKNMILRTFKDKCASLEELDSLLHQRDKKIVYIIDGLEDIFDTVSSNPTERTALKTLCTDFMNSIQELQYRSIGIVIFLRKDIAEIQNISKEKIHGYGIMKKLDEFFNFEDVNYEIKYLREH